MRIGSHELSIGMLELATDIQTFSKNLRVQETPKWNFSTETKKPIFRTISTLSLYRNYNFLRVLCDRGKKSATQLNRRREGRKFPYYIRLWVENKKSGVVFNFQTE